MRKRESSEAAADAALAAKPPGVERQAETAFDGPSQGHQGENLGDDEGRSSGFRPSELKKG